MGQIFNMDNKFFQFLNKAVDCVGLSVLWLLCCVPVVTAGALSLIHISEPTRPY